MDSKELYSLAQAIAARLPGGWHAEDPGGAVWTTLRAGDGSGLGLLLRNGDRRDTQMSVSVALPNQLALLMRGSVPSIRLNPTRPPQSIAADIERRLLPEARDFLARAQACAADHRTDVERVQAIVKRMVEASGGMLSPRSGYREETDITLYGYWPFASRAEVRISTSGVSLQAHSLPPDVAESLVTALARYGARTPAQTEAEHA